VDTSFWDERPLAEVEEELATLSAHLSAGRARWLELLAEFDRRLGWLNWGSCSHWLAWRCSLDGRTAREHVRVARALGGLPSIRAAFARGELSYAKVRALTRVSGPANEEELLDLAGELTASQLERSLAAAKRVDDDSARDAQESERVSWTWASDGSLVFKGRLAPEDGALFLQALGPPASGSGRLAESRLRTRSRRRAVPRNHLDVRRLPGPRPSLRSPMPHSPAMRGEPEAIAIRSSSTSTRPR
jgi:hypothetical protein